MKNSTGSKFEESLSQRIGRMTKFSLHIELELFSSLSF